MIEFFGGRCLEGINLAALGVDARHHVLDDTIFSGSIHGLENQQNRPAVLSVELVLKFRKGGNSLLQYFFSLFFGIEVLCIGGIELLHAGILSVQDAVRICPFSSPAPFALQGEETEMYKNSPVF